MIDYKDYGKRETTLIEILSAIAMVAMVGLVFYQLKFHPSNKGQLDCRQCHSPEAQKKERLTNYFKKNGSKTPEEMANAVLKTKSPRLLSAVAVHESGANPRVKQKGYRNRHDGAFQVNPKHWGKVPHDAVGQALQSEAIIQELVEEKGGIVAALNAYGGDTHGKYARTILAELVEVPR